MGPCPEGMEGRSLGLRPKGLHEHFNGAMPGGHGGRNAI